MRLLEEPDKGCENGSRDGILIYIEPEEEDYEVLRVFTAIIQQEGDSYVATCPEIDVASQGDTVDEARNNLKEALELFFEVASPEELQDLDLQNSIHSEPYVTNITVAVA